MGLHLGQVALGVLEVGHDLELGVLELADAAVQRDQLVLEPLEVLGVGDRTGVEALLVADPAGLDLLDVVVGLALGPGEVVDLDLEVGGLPAQRGAAALEVAQLGPLRRVGGLVAQRVETAVELLHVEELQLGGRVGFQDDLLGALFSVGAVERPVRPGRSTGR